MILYQLALELEKRARLVRLIRTARSADLDVSALIEEKMAIEQSLVSQAMKWKSLLLPQPQ